MPFRLESGAERIPGYKLIERLGGGGFGEVWKCEAPGGLLKAIKFVYGDLQCAGDDGARAEQELKALSRVKTVRHPYILSLERYDIIDGQLIIVMELADRNLWDRFRECRNKGLPGIPREELLRYMEETAEALDLMNIQYQLQHLDIKPQNLFLVHNHAKVADFGLVKDLEGVMASLTGGVTPVYAAPETDEVLSSGANLAAEPPEPEQTRWIHMDQEVQKDSEEAAPPVPELQISEDGVLVPALVIGLGQIGMHILRRLRENLQKYS